MTERCPARVELNDIKVAEHHYDCDLENGHDGPHAALGQPGKQTEWWIYWSLSASEIREVNACPAIRPERGQNDEEVLSLLYEGHPGRHSYELAPR